MEENNTRDLIRQLQAQIEAQARTIQEQQETQRKQAEKIETQEDNEGSSHGGHSEPDGGRKRPKSLLFTNLLPFTEAIMQTTMPEKPPPTLERYDGSAEPDNHLRNFIDAITFYTDSDLVICRAFSLSLKDEALEWYHTLPPNTVDCFATIKALFRRHYATNRRQEMTPTELRYNEAARRVKDANHTFIISNLPSCLRPGYFVEQLYAKPPKSMEELQETIAKFIRIEDLKNSRRKQQQEVPNNENKKEAKRSSNDNKGDRPPRKKKSSPKNADESKACRLHQNHGHNTEDCNIVRDEIERLVRAGYLQKYVKGEAHREISPPRRGTSHRSPKRLSHRDDRQGQRSRSRTRDLVRERLVRGRINTISGGFAGGGASSSACKRHLRSLKTVHMVDRQSRSTPNITFTDADFHAPDPDHDDPMVITTEIARYDISKVLIDQGSSVNILYWTTFLKMDLSEDLIASFNEQIVGFAGERVDTRGYLDLRTRLETGKEARELRVRFLLVEANTSYNALLGRPCLNAFGAIVSTPHLAMKFSSERGIVCTGDIKAFLLGKDESQTTTIGGNLEPNNEYNLVEMLRTNADLFAWEVADMPRIHPKVMTHRVSIFKVARPIAQKKQRFGEEKRGAIQTKVTKLLNARFIREVTYTT
ncbi:uncharacterized protein LOC108336606 [Vigna angularis]|uniref:uncharacterized protein LOC108336606 n=1 Tax=Phaseolus angularis TaxID=3914 RepID=UPI000809EE09|nr:uncharacterized protein LOC108336606 [Vigna angularis]